MNSRHEDIKAGRVLEEQVRRMMEEERKHLEIFIPPNFEHIYSSAVLDQVLEIALRTSAMIRIAMTIGLN